jgi:hypothetical protein
MRRVLWSLRLKLLLYLVLQQLSFGKSFHHNFYCSLGWWWKNPSFPIQNSGLSSNSKVIVHMESNVSCHPDESTLLLDVSEIQFSGLLSVHGILSSFSSDTIQGTTVIFHNFLQSSTEASSTQNKSDTFVSTELSLGILAFKSAERLCQISSNVSTPKKKKQMWLSLQTSAEKLQLGSTWESSALAVSLVFGALSLLQNFYETQEIKAGLDAKAAASAVSSTISRNKPLQQSGRAISTLLLRSYLINATHSDLLNLHILNHFVKAFHVGGGDCIEHEIAARAIEHALRQIDDKDIRMAVGDDSSYISSKRRISGALALACQLQPWSVLSPGSLVDAAIPFLLWHAAEEICRAAYQSSLSSSPYPSSVNIEALFSRAQQQENVKKSVERLIDAAMDDRMYRLADDLATNLYKAGGRSRYVEARFNHACETISKVIYRRQIPIVDRQIERVGKAVSKVRQDESTYGPAIPTAYDPSEAIRRFAIKKLEEAGDITSAKRLASVFGVDYVYDEHVILLAAAKRRQRCLQYEDMLSGAIPSLIVTPNDLLDAFSRLRKPPYVHGPFGLDAEWDEETNGAAVLQLANREIVILVDVPAMLGTIEGVKAMEATVGTLLDCTNSVVAGFACRQDLHRLRASPYVHGIVDEGCHHSHHWLVGTRAVVDVQNLVGIAEPKLVKAGLSRVCQHFFGKPLDKAEQCSLWSGRPLSDDQRAYAALDAWICVAIYQKLTPSLVGGNAVVEQCFTTSFDGTTR